MYGFRLYFNYMYYFILNKNSGVIMKQFISPEEIEEIFYPGKLERQYIKTTERLTYF